MAEPDPLQLADMLAASAWWPQLVSEEQRRTLAETEERRYTGGTVVMRKGEVVDAWIGEMGGAPR